MRQRGTITSEPAAFSVLELFVAIVVIVILATLMIPLISTLRARAQRAQCTANLRNLYVATELFIQRNGGWPQIPRDPPDASSRNFANAWLAALEPFGISRKSWICPTIQDLTRGLDYSRPESARLDYMPMRFDDEPMTPINRRASPGLLKSAMRMAMAI
jgi:type II secretory pathway pseudopilin PulG